MRRAFVVVIWLAVCGLFVAAPLLLPRSFDREVITKTVLEGAARRARPDVDPRYLPFTDEWRPASTEDMQKLASKWAAYADNLEVENAMAQRVLESQATLARRGHHLFWVAYTLLLIVCAGAAWLGVLKRRPPELMSVGPTEQAKPGT